MAQSEITSSAKLFGLVVGLIAAVVYLGMNFGILEILFYAVLWGIGGWLAYLVVTHLGQTLGKGAGTVQNLAHQRYAESQIKHWKLLKEEGVLSDAEYQEKLQSLK